MTQSDTTAGSLYIVATPIGHLDDITKRALTVLAKVDGILCEDTRVSSKLLNHYNIHKPLSSINRHNEEKLVDKVIHRLSEGESLALISDAGTPLISDPGHLIVKKAIDSNINIVSIPGPCALISALSISGLDPSSFCFEGFLSSSPKKRREKLKTLKDETRTLIFYEAPHRLIKSLTDMKESFGADRKIVLAKELTKMHEAVYRGTVDNCLQWIEENPDKLKGEFVILSEGQEVILDTTTITPEAKRILIALLEQMPLSKAVKLTVEVTGLPKNLIYDTAVQFKK